MPSLTPESRLNLISVIRADQSERWQRGEALRVEAYFSQYPDLADDTEAVIDLVYAEILLRLESGEAPSLAEYLGRFPAQAEALRQRWPQFRQVHPELHTHVEESQGTLTEERTDKLTGRAAPLLTLPGFELFERLGEGGMGVVFRARDIRLDQPRAIKVIRTGPFAGEQARARFNTEAKAVARLDHPGVVRIFALGEHEDILFICMEYLEGGSLQARLRLGRLDLRDAAELVRQLALAVQHAHDAGVLHRDLKPGNVLLSFSRDAESSERSAPSATRNALRCEDSASRLNSFVAKVSDFGLAKLLDADDGMTQTGAVMGTPSYMAPEQAEGSKAVGPAADVYALGAILYECLTGRAPFKTESRSGTLALVRGQPPVPPRQMRAEIPADLEAICLKCLEKASGTRYAKANDLAGDLENWQFGRTVIARGPLWLRMYRWADRNQRLVAACLFLGLVVTAAAIFYRSRRPESPPDPLAQIQEQLREGKSIDLIGATGKPRWLRSWRAEQNDTTTLEEDGTFSASGWRLTLLELLPSIDCGHYCIHAEVRHLKGVEDGAVGLFFAGTTQPQGEASIQSFFQVVFNDLYDLAALEAARFAKLPPKARPPLPQQNQVQIAACYYGDKEKKAIMKWTSTYFQPALFKPAGTWLRSGTWRTIRIVVSPSQARVEWADKTLVGVVNFARVEKLDNRSLDLQRKQRPNDPALVGLSSRLDPRGRIGLILNGSSASFRNVRVEPLAAPEPTR